ncbi:hypothetical protein QVD17_19888 [Tagetes erecta]|uniref:DUF8039 domain-containing protein n=1 Tax=Tagetes erecta TaxID=13708 RepID=A0AAD8KNV8_TARER|nr:hypothetical protein QVD17_19888 [Tagetes erecta]
MTDGATRVQERGSVSQVDVSHASRGSSHGSGGRLIDYPPINSMTPCELLLNVVESQLKVASGVAWPTSAATIIHGKLIVMGCVKVQVDETVTAFQDLPANGVTQIDEVTTIKDMLYEPTRGTPSNATSDASPTSYHPQDYMMHHEDKHVVVVNSFPQSLHQEYVMQNDKTQGGFMNMLLENMNRKNPFELHAPDLAPVPEPNFIDPNVVSALELIESRPNEMKALVEQLSNIIGDKYVVDVSSPAGMYPESIVESIPYSELDCKQQEGDYECGYMVIKHMEEFVNHIQHDVANLLREEDEIIQEEEIDNLIIRLIPKFINKAVSKDWFASYEEDGSSRKVYGFKFYDIS